MTLGNMLLVISVMSVIAVLANYFLYMAGFGRNIRFCVLCAIGLLVLVLISPKLGLMPWLWIKANE